MYELFITLYLLLSLSIAAVKIEILYYGNFVLLSTKQYNQENRRALVTYTKLQNYTTQYHQLQKSTLHLNT